MNKLKISSDIAGSSACLNRNLKLQHLTRLFENKEWVSDLLFSIVYIFALESFQKLQVVVYHSLR